MLIFPLNYLLSLGSIQGSLNIIRTEVIEANARWVTYGEQNENCFR